MTHEEKQFREDVYVRAVIKRLNRTYILQQAKHNEEKPFGFVIDFLKDEYSLPKSQGWNIAMRVLEHFNIDNNAQL